MEPIAPSTAGRPVVAALSAAENPDELIGALEGILHLSLGASAAKETAGALVTVACYDTAVVLGELTPGLLGSAGIPAGRATQGLSPPSSGARLPPGPLLPCRRRGSTTPNPLRQGRSPSRRSGRPPEEFNRRGRRACLTSALRSGGIFGNCRRW